MSDTRFHAMVVNMIITVWVALAQIVAATVTIPLAVVTLLRFHL